MDQTLYQGIVYLECIEPKVHTRRLYEPHEIEEYKRDVKMGMLPTSRKIVGAKWLPRPINIEDIMDLDDAEVLNEARKHSLLA